MSTTTSPEQARILDGLLNLLIQRQNEFLTAPPHLSKAAKDTFHKVRDAYEAELSKWLKGRIKAYPS